MENLYWKTFPTLEQAEAAIRQAALEEGHRLITGTTKVSSATMKPQWRLKLCSKFRPEPTEAIKNPQRLGENGRTGCPFRLSIVLNNNEWTITKGISDKQQHHNHGDLPIVAIPSYRRDIVEQYKDKIIRLSNDGLGSARIIRQLRTEYPELVDSLLPQDISNLLARHRRDELDGKTPIQWLNDHLSESPKYK